MSLRIHYWLIYDNISFPSLTVLKSYLNTLTEMMESRFTMLSKTMCPKFSTITMVTKTNKFQFSLNNYHITDQNKQISIEQGDRKQRFYKIQLLCTSRSNFLQDKVQVMHGKSMYLRFWPFVFLWNLHMANDWRIKVSLVNGGSLLSYFF